MRRDAADGILERSLGAAGWIKEGAAYIVVIKPLVWETEWLRPLQLGSVVFEYSIIYASAVNP